MINNEPAVARRSGRCPRILVVEDDQSLRREISATLEDFGFESECVANGHHGLRHALHMEFDAIVLDRMLPDIDGLSILATLRNLGREIPVLILSALAAVDERVRGLRAGGDDYVTKPFDGLELAARLNALLRRRTQPQDFGILSVGDLTLDSRTQVVHRAGQLIELKQREYGLLEQLMRHTGEVLTRAMLFEAVWNYHFNAQTNVIDMHISLLRRRISLNGTMPSMIHTVRNTGYIIHAAD